MHYYQIVLRQVQEVYTWQSTVNISLGSRVQVPFRNRERIGILVKNVSKPDFKTLAVKAVIDDGFIDDDSLALADYLSQTHFTPLSKVLTLMVPEVFWTKLDPVKKETQYQVSGQFMVDDLKHPKQKLYAEFLAKHSSLVWEREVPATFKNVHRTFLKNQWLKVADKRIIKEQSLKLAPADESLNYNLTSVQSQVLNDLLKQKQGSLLWGITGSGKTEIYKQYFSTLLQKNSEAQFLFLLPEIALTPQLISAFNNLFPDRVAVWHSDLTPVEKVQVWARVQAGIVKVLIGTRSASLVPIPNLKAIIVDEEHEWTFKNEFNPRFWAHEIVEFLADRKKIPFIYGTATPKIRTYHLLQTGKLKLFELKERVHQTKLPEINTIDLKQEAKRGNFSPLSERLSEAINKTLAAGKQVVLFLNKRGYAGACMCRFCGDTIECKDCSMPMKLHRNQTQAWLICHVCGAMQDVPKKCPSCEHHDFNFKGWGTQQLEEQLKERYPNNKIFRADRDSITGRYDFENLLNEFKQSPQSILLGTQMIAKGLDFADVALVGIVLADVGLHLPDHHAEERVYQLLEQVSGRAGRRHTQGQIVVQTFQDELPMFDYLRRHDTHGFLEQKYAEHQTLALPPLSRVIKITCLDKSKATTFAQCKALHAHLETELIKKGFEKVIEVNWAPAFFPKMHGKYYFHVFLKSADESALEDFIYDYDWPKEVKIDVSPVSLI